MTRYRAPHTKRTPILTQSEVLKQIFEDMTEGGIRLSDMGDRIGVRRNRLTDWRRGATYPPLNEVEEMARVLGYRLVLQKEEDKS